MVKDSPKISIFLKFLPTAIRHRFRKAGIFLMMPILMLLMGLDASGSFAAKSSLTDKLLAHLLSNHLQQGLLDVRNIPWPGGTYAINIEKRGSAIITSTADTVIINIPLRSKLKGVVDKDLGFTKILLNCLAQFDSEGILILTPSFTGEKITFKSQLKFPIPPVIAKCDNLTFPIDAVLRKMVADNKLAWQQQLDKQFNEGFR